MKGLKRYRGIAAAACLLLLPSVANAQAMKLSANQTVDIALENNYSLKVAESRVDQADARYLQTRKAYLPTVTLSETFVGTNDPAAVFSYKLRQRIVSPADLGNQYLINNPEAISNFQVGIEVMQPLSILMPERAVRLQQLPENLQNISSIVPGIPSGSRSGRPITGLFLQQAI